MKVAIITGMSDISFYTRISLRLTAIVVFLIGLFVSIPVAAVRSADSSEMNILDFQLVSDGQGWLLLGPRLFWTEDNGLEWREITPDAGQPILDVVFLDEQHGRALLGQNGSSQFILASTSDSGATWHSATYDFMALAQMPSAVADVHMGWRSVSDGWLVFKLATGSNFSVGLFYTTHDGGSTWQAHDIPLGEPALMIDAQNGWVAGGPAGRLYHTQDGGETWQEESPVSRAYYQTPMFVDELHGTLPALYAENETVYVELFQTDNAGQTWTSAGRVPLEADTPVDTPLPLSADDTGGLTLLVPNSNRLVRLWNGELTETHSEDEQTSNLVKLDMGSTQGGWGTWVLGSCETAGSSGDALNCVRETRLLSTNNGGSTWDALLLPGTGQRSIVENFSAPGKGESESVRALAADPDTEAYVGQGFDKCEVPTLTQMQKWWTSSPYNAVNLYIGGSARACANSALNDSYIAQLSLQGWRFIPTWVGPQANCAGYASRMSADPEVAYNQGLLQANLASDVAVDLELASASGSGTVIYYDLEAYNTSNAICRNAANAFISGWVAQMRERGNLAGVYGASCSSAVSDWASIANVPDALWIANWYDNAGSVSYRKTASVWGAACLSDSLWSDHQRIRQYAGGHDETWGGLTLNIDSNVIDGPLTVRDGTAGQSAPSQPLNLGPAHDSTWARTTDTWLTWKTTGDSCSVHIWGGSLDTTVNGNCSQYRLGVRAGGAYSWQVTATNESGSTTGPVWQFRIRPYAASNLTVASAAATKVNLIWQLSADDPANLDGYKIYQGGVDVATVSKGVSTYQVTGLACNTSYSFHMKSIRQGIESDVSNTIQATTTTCAPSLTNPADGLVLENRRPAFEWQPIEFATAYHIQVSPYANFSSVAINAQVPGTNYLAMSNLAVNTVYYWRVRGIGAFGNGDWSAVRSFKTPNPPSLPQLSLPANGGLVRIYVPKLDWTDSVLPAGTQLDRYQVQVASDSGFTALLHDQTPTLSEFVIPVALTPNSRYYWRVRAFNTLGQYTPWTTAWSFRTAVLPPVLLTPAAGTALEHRRPTFDWNDVSAATRYTLQISRYADFSLVLLSRLPVASQSVMTTDLPRNALLYWRVRAEAANGPSRWSEVRTFMTGNPPNTPVLLTPINNALLSSVQPKLDWGDVKAPVGTTLDHYQIQIATYPAFDTPVLDDDVTSSEYVLSTLLAANTKYYWRVRAFNSSGHYSSWSSVWYFRTAISPPELIAPEHDSTLTNLRPVFSWQAVTGGTSYRIQISNSSTFSTYLVIANVSSPTYTPSTNLPGAATLYWRVRALGPNGPSPWSEVYQLNTQ